MNNSTSASSTGVSIKDNKDKTIERNIDKVVFGDVIFKSWYPSWYPKEIIGEKGLLGDGRGIVVQTLYVCKWCFGYGKNVEEWARHCRGCLRATAGPPGRKIYTHGQTGTWSVWEVDGEVDTLFCQNLSLFAKLFLDNKSVFFDVFGFNYFLLVHACPKTGAQQIVGFFSKEKMSWDNNNLACILVFPPWQRKGLGAMLMGVSYEISRREEILGGPEKPISDLGKKGYRRFWGAEIARYVLALKETDRKKGKGMVTVEDVSKGTWIHPDDCLGVLREMGVVEKAGKGKGDKERVLLDKGKVRKWVEEQKLDLKKVVDAEGFLEGYAMKPAVEEESAA
ncbi:acyl-CoA N-acyltransferase [Bisporella sp. PMI_857]|nr:acyl-CoA N-acyltransferase [Bisporella sp. PMI_857]